MHGIFLAFSTVQIYLDIVFQKVWKNGEMTNTSYYSQIKFLFKNIAIVYTCVQNIEIKLTPAVSHICNRIILVWTLDDVVWFLVEIPGIFTWMVLERNDAPIIILIDGIDIRISYYEKNVGIFQNKTNKKREF